jgi:homoserine kinase type II
MTDSARHILEAYDLVPPIELFLMNGRGVNNVIQGVRTGAGDFVLKTYQTHASVAVIENEHRLLRWLTEAGLPFAVPAPLPARDGSTICWGPPAHWHALFTWLPGGPGDARQSTHLAAAGQALGAVHARLKLFPADPSPGVAAFGDLDHIHPQVPDPLELFTRHQAYDGEEYASLLQWWETEVRALRAFVEHAYTALPTQTIHGDFVMGNLLFQADDVTAVLDWEFAAQDVRAMDVATLLVSVLFAHGGAGLRGSTKWLGVGYRKQIQLTVEEVEALPWLIRLWLAVNLIWRVGQDVAAGTTHPVQIDRLLRAREAARWLEHHADDVKRAFSA